MAYNVKYSEWWEADAKMYMAFTGSIDPWLSQLPALVQPVCVCGTVWAVTIICADVQNHAATKYIYIVVCWTASSTGLICHTHQHYNCQWLPIYDKMLWHNDYCNSTTDTGECSSCKSTMFGTNHTQLPRPNLLSTTRGAAFRHSAVWLQIHS